MKLNDSRQTYLPSDDCEGHGTSENVNFIGFAGDLCRYGSADPRWFFERVLSFAIDALCNTGSGSPRKLYSPNPSLFFPGFLSHRRRC